MSGGHLELIDAINILTSININLIGKDPDAGKDWKQEKRATEDEYNRLDGITDSMDLACCGPLGFKE